MTTIAEMLDLVLDEDARVRVVAWDGSSAGPESGVTVRLLSPAALSHIVTAPSELGLARAYLMDELTIDGMDEANPYETLKELGTAFSLRRPDLKEVAGIVRTLREAGFHLPDLPPQETPSPLRRLAHGLRHGRQRDADAIHHHYDVGNEFYEFVLGPSMTYTCALFETPESTLEQAQAAKHDLIARKLDLRPGMRLLDIGCGWGGMVRHAVEHYGVTALGVTLSKEQATWAQERIERDGLADRAEIRHGDYRDVTERGFDAISSIGLTEHIGVKNYPAYFAFLHDHLRDEGRLLNHCITRPDNKHAGLPNRGFINRYVFPDGELTGSGDIVRIIEDHGLEVQHHENLRQHYALTLAEWSTNLAKHWDQCVELVGTGTARVWGLYLAGSRIGFQDNGIQLHQVLATRTSESGSAAYPLRPSFT